MKSIDIFFSFLQNRQITQTEWLVDYISRKKKQTYDFSLDFKFSSLQFLFILQLFGLLFSKYCENLFFFHFGYSLFSFCCYFSIPFIVDEVGLLPIFMFYSFLFFNHFWSSFRSFSIQGSMVSSVEGEKKNQKFLGWLSDTKCVVNNQTFKDEIP